MKSVCAEHSAQQPYLHYSTGHTPASAEPALELDATYHGQWAAFLDAPAAGGQ
ncbi:MAG: hypothetical protein JJT87_03750 [Halomonas sp.]|uniref:hypothetical protein n=1 Tax=unclassified Halomonas TaxID=2609666 RepID=UPI00131C1ECC|nr:MULTISPECIES: hypothetical protein [unclassified Halomonas]MCC5901034.1 hypothetical protein [Halomonas sp.]